MTAQGIDSRKSANAILFLVLKEQKTVEEALAATKSYSALAPQDRSFCHHLVMTVLRNKGALDALLAEFMSKPLKASRLDVQCCLYIGAAQLVLMEVADHAAVDTSVRLAKRHQAALAGLVNAVLKKVSKQGKTWWAEQNIAAWNVPPWLWHSWVKAYGKEQANAIAVAHTQEPAVDISVKDPAKLAHWAEALEAEILPTDSLRKSGSSRHVQDWEGFAEGAWWVQELAASLPVKLLAASMESAGGLKGRRVLDCCAAPGGKTAQLAALGAEVVAIDQSGYRLKRLYENMERLDLSAEAIEADLLEWEPDEKFDAILLDAPCSATGTIRRHPELPWLRELSDVERLVEIQQQLLNRAITWLKPEGLLLYAVCSLQPEEGEGQVAEALAKNADSIASVAFSAGLLGEGAAEWITPQGHLRCLPSTLPDTGHMDGFFAAMFASKKTV